MSIVYALAGVLILNPMVPPTFTLMSVENPWMVESPEPLMSHTEGSVPGRAFSHTTGFAVALQSLAACAGWDAVTAAHTSNTTARNPARGASGPKRRVREARVASD